MEIRSGELVCVHWGLKGSESKNFVTGKLRWKFCWRRKGSYLPLSSLKQTKLQCSKKKSLLKEPHFSFLLTCDYAHCSEFWFICTEVVRVKTKVTPDICAWKQHFHKKKTLQNWLNYLIMKQRLRAIRNCSSVFLQKCCLKKLTLAHLQNILTSALSKGLSYDFNQWMLLTKRAICFHWKVAKLYLNLKAAIIGENLN